MQRCVQLRRHLAGSLRSDVTAAVTALAVPVVYKKESTEAVQVCVRVLYVVIVLV